MNKKKFISICLTLCMMLGICTAYADDVNTEAASDVYTTADADEFLRPYIAEVVGAKMNTNGRVGSIGAGAYVHYSGIDFGVTGYTAAELTYGVDDSWGGSDVEVYIDSMESAPVAVFTLKSTGSFSVSATISAALTKSVSGVHDVYVKFLKAAACDFFGISFTTGSSSTSGGVNIPNGVYSLENPDTAIKLYILGVLDAEDGFSPEKFVTNSYVLAAMRRISSSFTIDDAEFEEKYGFAAADNATPQSITKIFGLTAGYGSINAVPNMKVFNNARFVNNNITQKEFVKCLDNFLDVKVVTLKSTSPVTYAESDLSVMNKCMGIYEYEGVIKSNRYTSFDGKEYPYDVLIGDIVFRKNAVDVDGMLGYNVKAYYSKPDGDNYSLLAAIPTKNNVLELTSDDDISRDGLKISYEKEGKERKVNIDSGFVLIYNEIFTSVFDNSIFTDFYGTIKLVDCNDDNKYDCVLMTDTEDVFVKSVTGDDVIYGENGWKLDLSDKDYVIKSAGGTVIAEDEINGISSDSVISVGKSYDNTEEFYTIIVSSKTVSGEVIRTADHDGKKYVVVNDEEYQLSRYCTDTNAFAIGDDATLYLTAQNKVMRILGYTSVEKLGYIDKVYIDVNEEKVYVKMFTEDGEYIRLECADRMNIDKKSCKRFNDIQKAMEEEKNKSLADKDLVNYSLNAEGKLKMLDYPYYYIGFTESDDSTKCRNSKESANSLFISFKGGGQYKQDIMSIGGVNFADKEAKVFIIPDTGDYTDYSVMTASAYFKQDSTYTDVRGYGSDVNYIKSTAYLINEAANAEPSEMAPACFIKSIERLNVYFDDDIYSSIKYLRNGEEYSAMVEQGSEVEKILSYLKTGDMVQMTTDSYGIAENLEPMYLTSRNRIYDTEAAQEYGRTKTYVTSAFGSGRWVVDGTVKRVLGDYVIITDKKTNSDVIANVNNPAYFGQNIYAYDKNESKNNIITHASFNDIVEGSEITVMLYYGNVNGCIVKK